MKLTRKQSVKRRHMRVRRKISGTEQRPRLTVRKTLHHIHAQVVDDSPEGGSRTIATYSTANGNQGKHMRNQAQAQVLGKSIGEDLKGRGIETIVFDRGGYQYHGIVKALADAVRETGIRF